MDLGTLWNDRLLQRLDSLFRTDPGELLRSDPRGLYESRPPSRPRTFWGFQVHGLALNPREDEWRQACGCWIPDFQHEDDDWIPGPPPWPPCRLVCRREPLPVFVNALPKVRTLVLTAMDNPIKWPRRAAMAHRELFSSWHDGKHALITAGEDRYSITNPIYRGADVSLPTLERIKSEWRRKFPYLERMPKVRVKYMRPIEGPWRPRKRDDSRRPFRSSDTDIPYIYEIKEPAPTSSRKRPRHSSGSQGNRKRRRTGHSSSSGGRSDGKDGRAKSRGRSRGRSRKRKSKG